MGSEDGSFCPGNKKPIVGNLSLTNDDKWFETFWVKLVCSLAELPHGHTSRQQSFSTSLYHAWSWCHPLVAQAGEAASGSDTANRCWRAVKCPEMLLQVCTGGAKACWLPSPGFFISFSSGLPLSDPLPPITTPGTPALLRMGPHADHDGPLQLTGNKHFCPLTV